MRTLVQDLRYGLRVLVKSKGFAAVAVVTLALGIGANTAIFSLIDKLLWRQLPVSEPGRLVLLSAESLNPRFLNTIFSYPDYKDYRDRNSVLSGLVAFRDAEVTVGAGEGAERVNGELVSGNYFDVLGVRAERGRAIRPEDDAAPGQSMVVVLSHGLWQRRFGADPPVVGQTVTLGGASYTVVGVAPAGFNGLALERPTYFWVPLAAEQQLTGEQLFALDKRGAAWLRLVGRLKPGVSLEQARAGLDLLARQVRDANTPEGERGRPFYERRMLLEPGGGGISILRKDLSKPLELLLATVGLILLVACANVANLLFARAAARRKEVAVRLALGAGRARLVRQLLTESVLLALAGGTAGLLFAEWLTGLLLTYNPYKIDLAQTSFAAGPDARVLAFTFAVSTLCGVVFGLIPALQSSRPDLLPALKGEVSALGRKGARLGPRGPLVVLQVALALVVLVGAGLLVRSLRNLFAIDPGFRAAGVLLVPVSLDSKNYDEPRARAFLRELNERLRALPGVASVTTATVTPMGGGVYTRSLTVEGYAPQPGENIGVDANEVGPGYHELMGIPLVEGRGFTERDAAGAPPVAVINEAMARQYFPGQNPLGRHLFLGKGSAPLEIVGVARDSKFHSLTEPPLAHLDTPILQDPYAYRSVVFHVRAKADAAALLADVRREVKALDPALPFADAGTLTDELGNSLAAARMAAQLSALFGAVALLLSAVGLYGAISYSVEQRTREIGIRMALGARPRDVLALVIAKGLLLTAAGAGLGLAAALALTRLASGLLYGVSATDPTTFAAVALLLSAVALAACYVPARRATKVDPMVALRYE
ncbi:MAG TPA: ABC transporter permease [Pyrinomonadaceae bacterium]|nr:ABC transporter permease [Pyrinomonadaceae bacterium]